MSPLTDLDNIVDIFSQLTPTFLPRPDAQTPPRQHQWLGSRADSTDNLPVRIVDRFDPLISNIDVRRVSQVPVIARPCCILSPRWAARVFSIRSQTQMRGMTSLDRDMLLESLIGTKDQSFRSTIRHESRS